jgi:hypothetical protein
MIFARSAIARRKSCKSHVTKLLGGCLVICLLCATINLWKSSLLLRRIHAIPHKEKSILEAFFSLLMLREGGAYVLFGHKPVAFTAFQQTERQTIGIRQLMSYERENQILKQGWNVWKKYAHLFPSTRFCLECRPFNETRAEICLINLETSKHIIEQNLKDFQNILGQSFTSERLIESYLNGRHPLFYLLHQHHALLGILLGFGTHNAWIFYENTPLRYEDPFSLTYHPLKKIHPGYHSSAQNPLKSVYQEKNHRKCFKFLYLPYFLADLKSKETHELQAQYRKEQAAIHEAYAHGNVLEVTLKQFCH